MGVEADGPVLLLLLLAVAVVIESAKAILEPTHPRGNYDYFIMQRALAGSTFLTVQTM